MMTQKILHDTPESFFFTTMVVKSCHMQALNLLRLGLDAIQPKPIHYSRRTVSNALSIRACSVSSMRSAPPR